VGKKGIEVLIEGREGGGEISFAPEEKKFGPKIEKQSASTHKRRGETKH